MSLMVPRGDIRTEENVVLQDRRLVRRGAAYLGMAAAGVTLTGSYLAVFADSPAETYQRTYGEDYGCLIEPVYDKYYGAKFRVMRDSGKLVLRVIPAQINFEWLSSVEYPELTFDITDPRFADAELVGPANDVTTRAIEDCNKP